MSEAENDNPGLPHIPPTYPAAFLLLAIILEFLVPLSFLAAPAFLSLQTLIGVALVAGGIALDIWAFRLFKAAGTNPEPFKPTNSIVEDGPYRMTRNPMYVGFLLIFAGLALIFALEWGVIALPLLWLTLDRVVVVREEAYLTAKFGETYTQFLARTRRWI
jgi:protein-S-isoprenylcysteine O-methyltransferase Ste14